jgi:hypothetical protein
MRRERYYRGVGDRREAYLRAAHNTLLTEFKPWMPVALKEHIAEGWSLDIFPAKHLINRKIWYSVVIKQEQMAEIIQEYKVNRRKKST